MNSFPSNEEQLGKSGGAEVVGCSLSADERRPIHSAELRRTGVIAAASAAMAGGAFGLLGAIIDFNGMWGIFLGSGSMVLGAFGMIFYFLFILFFTLIFAASFFVVSLFTLLIGLLVLAGISRAWPVSAGAERWILAAAAGGCCGAAGAIAVALWFPLGIATVFGGLSGAGMATTVTFRKIVPPEVGAAGRKASTPASLPIQSVWEDLE